MPKLCSLFSGSDGNAVFIASGSSRLLVDAGVPTARIKAALESHGESFNELDGILITHGHGDHIKALNVLLKKYPVPLYASEETLLYLTDNNYVPAHAILRVIDRTAEIGGFEVTRFGTPHDAAGSSGYVITLSNSEKVAVCTDLGYVTDEVRNAITGCRSIVLESNHDITMLQNGIYTPDLKRRIAGKFGHLSNTACADELPDLVKAGAVRFVLAHLSRQNNRPEIAEAAAVASLLSEGMKQNEDYRLHIAAPAGNPMITI